MDDKTILLIDNLSCGLFNWPYLLCTYYEPNNYAYDALLRVTQARYFDGQSSLGTPTRQYNFAYDKSSNRTNETLFWGGVQQYSNNWTYTYNGANQISSGGFVYDNNGNLTNDGSQSYTWDRANRLLAHQDSSYAYNGLGQRVSQTVSSIVTEYLQDTQPGLFKMIKSQTGANIERFIHDPMGIHSHESNSGVWDWALKDGLGSVRDVRNSVGNSVYNSEYALYGQKFDIQGTNPTLFEYTCESFDQNGLSYHHARYYDPALGNFISQDPLELINRYGYDHPPKTTRKRRNNFRGEYRKDVILRLTAGQLAGRRTPSL
jgi:RHS repeat-associated protein